MRYTGFRWRIVICSSLVFLVYLSSCSSRVGYFAVQHIKNQNRLVRVALERKNLQGVRDLAFKKLKDEKAFIRYALEYVPLVVVDNVIIDKTSFSYCKEAIAHIRNQAALAKIAQDAKSVEARCEAVCNLTDQIYLSKLAKIYSNDIHSAILLTIVDKLDDQIMLAKIAQEHASPFYRLKAVSRLTDQELLFSVIARKVADDEVQCKAVGRLTNQTLLAKVAIENCNADIRKQAAQRLPQNAPLGVKMWIDPVFTRQVSDQAVLADIATKAENVEVRCAAIGVLEDRKILAQIANSNEKQDVIITRQLLTDPLVLPYIGKTRLQYETVRRETPVYDAGAGGHGPTKVIISGQIAGSHFTMRSGIGPPYYIEYRNVEVAVVIGDKIPGGQIRSSTNIVGKILDLLPRSAIREIASSYPDEVVRKVAAQKCNAVGR